MASGGSLAPLGQREDGYFVVLLHSLKLIREGCE